LNLAALNTAGLSVQKNKPDAQLMVHVQSTGFGSGSETLGGRYPAIPEPTAGALFALGSLVVGAAVRRSGCQVRGIRLDQSGSFTIPQLSAIE
jgi:hypothetical protein